MIEDNRFSFTDDGLLQIIHGASRDAVEALDKIVECIDESQYENQPDCYKELVLAVAHGGADALKSRKIGRYVEYADRVGIPDEFRTAEIEKIERSSIPNADKMNEASNLFLRSVRALNLEDKDFSIKSGKASVKARKMAEMEAGAVRVLNDDEMAVVNKLEEFIIWARGIAPDGWNVATIMSNCLKGSWEGRPVVPLDELPKIAIKSKLKPYAEFVEDQAALMARRNSIQD